MNRNIQDLTTATAYDRDGEKLGSVKEVYVNDSTGQPDFVEVGHGLFGMSSSIVPLRGHRLEGENLQLAFSKDRIQDAPNIRDDDHLSEEDHATIYRHYGLDGTPNETEYEPHRFDDDYDTAYGERFDHDRTHERELREADLRDRELIDPVTGEEQPGVTAPGVIPAAGGPAPGTDVHGFGDHRRDG
ncbi:PRC-barrel domain-containing protein, partial [Corynebacterium nasicanis]